MNMFMQRKSSTLMRGGVSLQKEHIFAEGYTGDGMNKFIWVCGTDQKETEQLQLLVEDYYCGDKYKCTQRIIQL